MSAECPVGVDANGYVVTIGAVPVQPEFEPLLADVLATLSQPAFGLDGIYLYGSVARGDATAEASDLDLTLVLRDSPQAPLLEQLELARLALEQRHSCVTKIDFDIGHRAQVLAPENHNRWGFWLKHHCRCVWGDDLGLRLEPFRPSRDIALALNDDFAEVLSSYRVNIMRAADTPQRLRLQREAARKLIRSTHTLRSPEALMWPRRRWRNMWRCSPGVIQPGSRRSRISCLRPETRALSARRSCCVLMHLSTGWFCSSNSNKPITWQS